MTMARAQPQSAAVKIALRTAQALAPFLLLAALWQTASFSFPKYLFPPLTDVAAHVIAIFASWSQFAQVLATIGRILAGLVGAFVIGAVLAAAMMQFRFIGPILTFFQGIPALSWWCSRSSGFTAPSRASSSS